MSTTLRTPTLIGLKIALIAMVLMLGVIITTGVIFVEQTPELTTRALFAMVKAPLLAYEFSSIPEVAMQREAQSVPVLTYHRIVSDSSDINNVSISNFKDQMVALKKAGWHTVTLADFEAFIRGEKSLPDKSFLLTFDDGAKDSFYPVDPILKSLGFHGVNFIIVASANTPHSVYYLNPNEIKWMLRTGRWSIASHSYDGHRPYQTSANGSTGIFFADLLWLPDKNRIEMFDEFRTRVHNDLTEAKSDLESTYHVPIMSFAFPLGNETGIEGANNFPGGSSQTQEIADEIYDFGFLQHNRQYFTASFPRSTMPTTSPQLADPFIVRRVHVDYDWDGKRVLSILENSRPKPIPYEDDFTVDHGWISAWGTLEIGQNNLTLSGRQSTSASAFLDGSALWDNYTYETSLNWQSGHAILLSDVINSQTYDACVYSEGGVRIQHVENGKTKVLGEKLLDTITFGDVKIGMRVHDRIIECTWNYESVVESYERTSKGGIGLQVWDPEIGKAEMRVASLIVRPYSTSTSQ